MAGTATAIGSTELGSGIVTTTVGQVDTVTFGRDIDSVFVFNYDGADWLWVTTDGTAASVGGKNSFPIPPGQGAGLKLSVPTSGGTVVQIAAATATKYVVVENR